MEEERHQREWWTVLGSDECDTQHHGRVATDTGAYTVVVTNTRNLVVTSTTSSAGNLIMNLAPVITTQPHDTTIVTGGSASFTVVATGSGTLSYQWKKNGTNVSGGHSRVRRVRHSVTGAVATDTGAYTVVVSNTRNLVVTSTTSSAGNLIMNLAPVITTQPHDTTIVTGGSASFTVAATGSGTLSYQWKKNGTNVSGGQFSGRPQRRSASRVLLPRTRVRTRWW